MKLQTINDRDSSLPPLCSSWQESENQCFDKGENKPGTVLFI